MGTTAQTLEMLSLKNVFKCVF